MAVHKGIIEGISHKYDKFSVVIDGNWYGTKKEYAAEWPAQPNVGDEITWDDGGKKYLGKMKIVTKGVGGSGPKASAPRGSTYSSLGVELGHASNLAMRIMEQSHYPDMEVGSTDYYKDFVKTTRKVYAIMKGLREEFETPAVTDAATEANDDVVVMKTEEKERPDAELEDIF